MRSLRIHHVRLDPDEVHLGATTEERWAWELEDGAASAVNATDLVWVTITRPPPGRASAETIGLFPGRGSPEREAALAAIPALLEAAWRVLDGGWDAGRAHDELYGLVLEP
ncbi:MAG: hypothetical protein H6719_07995 [Sandaracinaceae bacterium]|nr:hypothetical protein [Sandaracinaceae bacterium]